MNNSTNTLRTPSTFTAPDGRVMVVVGQARQPRPVHYPYLGRDAMGRKVGWCQASGKQPDGRRILEQRATWYPRDPNTGKIIGWWRKAMYVVLMTMDVFDN